MEIMRSDHELEVSLLVISYLGYSVTSISGDLSDYCESHRTKFIFRTKFIENGTITISNGLLDRALFHEI